jgi:hypothetical protein
MRLKLLFLLFFVFSFAWAQTTHTFSTPTTSTFKIPAGVTSLSIECWGGGGAGGGVHTTALVSLFGGGGGGGGAYIRASTFGVTPAAVLSYKVGSGGVGANGADGPNGENTTFSTVTANGGTGGTNGNLTDGVGGAGGTTSGIGSFFGGNGSTSGLVGVILPVLSSGGGGSSAGPGPSGTGVNGNNANNALVTPGGAAVTGGGKGGDGMAVLGGGIGNSGDSPGGGGAGALGLLNANYKGGNGGNGQIKVIYTCPVYGLTAPATADDVCTAIGTTTLVRITGGASLPNGDYVVTYNRSNPSLGGTGLTAAMSVTGGTGIGTFTAVGLSVAGASTITVTNLTSESCTNVISTNRTVTINVYSASVAGTINTPAAICSGGTGGLLTLSGSTGIVLGWESSVSPFSSWTPISNTTSTHAPGVLTETTQFRATVKNGVCTQQTSAIITVTVNPLPIITGTLETCVGLTTTLTGSAAPNVTNPWISATPAVATVTNTGLVTGVSVGTSIITYTNSNGCIKTATVTVYPKATITTAVTPAIVNPVCQNTTTTTMSYTGTTGTILGYTIDWITAGIPNQGFTSSAFNPAGGSLTGINIPVALASGTYLGTLTIVTDHGCPTTKDISLTIFPKATITTAATPAVVVAVCQSSGSQTTTMNYSATTANPVNYKIVWTGLPLQDYSVSPVTFNSGTGSVIVDVPAGTAAGTYNGVMTIATIDGCFTDKAVTLTITPTPSAPIPGTITEPTCVTSTGSVTLSGLPASVNWLIKQTGTASTTYTDTGTTYTVSNLLPGNYTFTVEYTGSCISLSSANVVVNNLVTNTYNIIGGWSNGTPTINQNLIFASDHTTAGGGLGNINGCTCMVNLGINVVINSYDTLTINKAVVNNGGTLTFENNASLVQMANVANTGNIIYKRKSTPMKNFDFTCWSSPVTGQTLFNLSPNTLSDKYLSYTGTGWKTEAPITTVMIRGKGYGIRTPKAGLWLNGENVVFPYSQPVQFIGIPNNGNITGEIVVAGNSYLVGNPYPCAIDADAFLFANPNPNNSAILEGTIYFWTHNTAITPSGNQFVYSSTDYASYNGVGGTATLPAASGGAVPNGKIAAGQSFFVQASNNGTIIFNNGMRISGDNSYFFKPGKSSKSSLLEKHRLWLNMTNTGGAFKQLLIGYIQGATNGFDSNFDGVSLNGNAFIDFYSINLASNLVIQGRALPFTESDMVSLGYRTIIEGEFTISISQGDGILANQPVYLEDRLTNTINDLRQGDYTFKTKAGVFNNRFLLKYTNKTLANDDFDLNNDVLVWIDNKNIRLSSKRENIDKVFIYDISGKLVYNNTAISASEVIISNLKFKDEVLLTKIVLTNDHILTKKIITTTK